MPIEDVIMLCIAIAIGLATSISILRWNHQKHMLKVMTALDSFSASLESPSLLLTDGQKAAIHRHIYYVRGVMLAKVE